MPGENVFIWVTGGSALVAAAAYRPAPKGAGLPGIGSYAKLTFSDWHVHLIDEKVVPLEKITFEMMVSMLWGVIVIHDGTAQSQEKVIRARALAPAPMVMVNTRVSNIENPQVAHLAVVELLYLIMEGLEP